jgi:hypothetical protein
VGPEEGGPQVFQGMQGGHIDYRLLVGLFETKIEGGKHGFTKTVFPGNKNPRFKPQVIHLKTGNLFHVHS